MWQTHKITTLPGKLCHSLIDYIFIFQDPKRHLEEHVDVVMTSNIVQCLAAMLDTVVFK